MDSRKGYRFSDAIDISYRVCGSGPRQVLMLHGFGASSDSWEDVRPLLENRCTLYLLDLKGYGLSSKPKDYCYSPEHQAEIVAAFIEAMDFQDLTLVGHSLGGALALRAYLKLAPARPAAIRSLVLISAAVYPQSYPFFIRTLRRRVLNFAALNLTTARYLARDTLRRIVRDPAKITPERVERYAGYWGLPGAHHALVCSARQILPRDIVQFIETLKTISVPVLIIWGREDPVTPVENAWRLNRDIKDSDLAVIENCGHLPPEEEPEVVAALIRDFLD